MDNQKTWVIMCPHCGGRRKITRIKSRTATCFFCGKTWTFRPKKDFNKIDGTAGARDRMWQKKDLKEEDLDFYSYKK